MTSASWIRICAIVSARRTRRLAAPRSIRNNDVPSGSRAMRFDRDLAYVATYARGGNGDDLADRIGERALVPRDGGQCQNTEEKNENEFKRGETLAWSATDHPDHQQQKKVTDRCLEDALNGGRVLEE